MAPNLRPQCVVAGLVLTALSAGCTALPEEPARLWIAFDESASYPVALLRIAGGPNRELLLDGSAFRRKAGPLGSDSIPLPPANGWPLRAALVSATGDTLVSTVVPIDLKSAQLTSVSLLPRRSRAGVFICAPIVAKAPISTFGPTPDTLYVLSHGPAAFGTQFPVC